MRYERRVQGTAAIGPLDQRHYCKPGFVEVSILRPEGALALPSREGGSRSETGELKT